MPKKEFGVSVNNLLDILLSVGVKSKEEMAAILRQTYTETIDKYRPLIGAISMIVPELIDDLVPPLVGILRAANRLTENEELQVEIRNYRANKAKRCKEFLNAFIAAGFNRNEALLLVLQEIASTQSSVTAIRQAASKSRSIN